MGAFVLFVVLVVDSFALAVVIYMMKSSDEKRIAMGKYIEEQRAIGKGPAKGKGLHHAKPGRRTAAVIQVSFLLFCYCISRFIASAPAWKDHPEIALIFLVLGIIFVPVGGYVLGCAVPHIAMLTARGDLILQEYHVNWLHVILAAYWSQRCGLDSRKERCHPCGSRGACKNGNSR
eukprot:gnl/TRDRNA2_/TRDRNA2_66858_c0_seq1.p1 gnl/TRDRNA2_/TRDRNA2_66858_c0~~gnl/TRDRNA2_/TRDRNA2_66858_c0_seq1.p1  ORF type:complete len:197 (+),score=21.38 gnl/TRDRNA2_/TRDRNA2_66858_c0_seq1:66-593(+)